jgi:type I restriction enzyme, S subunit
VSRYKAYQAYRDSGVEWLGKIPCDWDCVRLKFASELSGVKVAPSNAERYVGLENVQSNSGKFISTEEITPEGMSNAFSCGDVLFGKLRPYLAKSWLADFSGICSSEFLVLTSKKVDAKFLHYFTLTEEFIEQVDSSTYGSKMPRASWDFIGLLDIPVPPHESKKIAEFLDHETAKIDALIEKQQRLIELLKEKRQAVISHAVTKGLNPNAPMKDSGVEWLGEVPAHWDLQPLKYLCSFSGGGTPSKDNLSYWTEGNIPWVSPKDMKSFWINDSQDKITQAAVQGSSTNFVDAGSLLIVVRSGILQRTIPIAINTVPVTLNQDMKALSFISEMNVEYAANFILGNIPALLLEWSKEGATVESIEHEYLSSSFFPVPPYDEQLEINATIRKRMESFDALEQQASTGITLLQERRSALISAAVTGKMDVRDWQAAA